jgi:outer membrane protein TolC
MATSFHLKKSKTFIIPVFLVLALSSISIGSYGQRDSTQAAADSVRATEEKLVQLALNGPVMKELQHRNRINELELTRAQRNWVNLLTVSANYNDQSFAKNAPGTVVYPRYFFGLTVPLGTILSRTEVKSARENIEISKLNQQQLARTIRAEVLAKYRQYRAYDQLIEMQGELLNDVQASLLQTEDKFRKGQVDVEVYTAAQRSKSEVAARQVNLQLEQDLIKIDLERLIGTRLDDVIR